MMRARSCERRPPSSCLPVVGALFARGGMHGTARHALRTRCDARRAKRLAQPPETASPKATAVAMGSSEPQAGGLRASVATVVAGTESRRRRGGVRLMLNLVSY